jgi:hypothetical protein
MAKISDTGFSPNTGIERILRNSDGPGRAALPASSRVVPTDAVTGLDALHDLYASSWDRSMRAFLQPRIRAREVFIPGVFAARLRKARQELAEESRRKKSKALRDASLVLEDDEDLKELLDMYRNLLLQG